MTRREAEGAGWFCLLHLILAIVCLVTIPPLGIILLSSWIGNVWEDWFKG